jgi:hypothetical protein
MDLIVNEESEKANELFHQIVVEKSREIYENLIAEEAEEEMDEAADEEMDESDEEMDESADEEMDESDEEMDESMDLEDSYSMEAGDEEGDATDKFGSDIGADDEEGEDDGMGMDDESSEETAIMDIKSAIEELEAAFAELEHAKGGGSDFGSDEEPMGGDDEMGMMGGSDDMMGKPAFEGRRVTREYVEKVGNDWEKNSQKSQGQYVGAGTGDKESAPVEGRSPVSSGKGKPTTGATAANIAKTAHEGGTNTGTSPAGKAGGFLSAAKNMNTGNGNVPGGKMGVKNLSNVKGGHGAEKKGSGPGPVGSGTGDKAGQTSVGQAKSPINGAPNRNA